VKTDRRTGATRRLLRRALLELIQERGYNEITVEDITNRADRGRTTFYLHYRDKDALLVESLEATAENLRQQVEQLAASTSGADKLNNNPLRLVFNYLYENRALYQTILKGEGNYLVSSRIREFTSEAARSYFRSHMSDYAAEPPEIPGDLVAGYFASALVGYINYWLDRDLPLDGDQAADLFMKLFFRGASRILKLSVEF
jgi:AcrR family transcriptional regulator